jgi:hypothetical protein
MYNIAFSPNQVENYGMGSSVGYKLCTLLRYPTLYGNTVLDLFIFYKFCVL